MAPMRVALRQGAIIGSHTALPLAAVTSARVLRGRSALAAVSFRKRNCEMFPPLFRASVNHNDRQTSRTNLRSFTRALLLGFK